MCEPTVIPASKRVMQDELLAQLNTGKVAIVIDEDGLQLLINALCTGGGASIPRGRMLANLRRLQKSVFEGK